ncbi:hypothetical protein [Methylacidiphilum kamchatkense]|uniref:AsmA-like C-terminal domain-containing protein n=1 Tax=Methylacidiphilum kamchatkense Kam1 TaxID=1202785 RepID=A0A516TPD9_9BACT|nr:hypothetical protein [Methylacidiphilum kamchatkense]QDQ43106.1 hypothetical protein kam1_1894 [Methylacidiphilum kamchatkense Kam1]
MKQQGKKKRVSLILLSLLIFFAILVFGAFGFIWWVNAIVKSKAFADYASKIVEKYTAITGSFEPFMFYGFGLETSSYKGKGNKESPIASIAIAPLTVQLRSIGIFGRPWIIRSIELGDLSVVLQNPELPPERKTEKLPTAAALKNNKEKTVSIEKISIKNLSLSWPATMGGGGQVSGMELNVLPKEENWDINAHRGVLLLNSLPELSLENIKGLLTKTSFEVSETTLHLKSDPKVTVLIQGTMALVPPQKTHLNLSLHQIPLDSILIGSLRNELKGYLRGNIGLNAESDIAKTYHGEGEMFIDQGRLVHLTFLTNIDSFLNLHRLEDIPLTVAHFLITLEPNTIKLHHIDWQSEDTMMLTGWVTLVKKNVTGTLMLGLRSDWIQKLPGLGAQLFNAAADGFFWTEIHLSGTIDDIHEDFSPRLNQAVQGIIKKGIEREIQRQVPERIFRNIIPNFP